MATRGRNSPGMVWVQNEENFVPSWRSSLFLLILLWEIAGGLPSLDSSKPTGMIYQRENGQTCLERFYTVDLTQVKRGKKKNETVFVVEECLKRMPKSCVLNRQEFKHIPAKGYYEVTCHGHKRYTLPDLKYFWVGDKICPIIPENIRKQINWLLKYEPDTGYMYGNVRYYNQPWYRSFVVLAEGSNFCLHSGANLVRPHKTQVSFDPEYWKEKQTLDEFELPPLARTRVSCHKNTYDLVTEHNITCDEDRELGPLEGVVGEPGMYLGGFGGADIETRSMCLHTRGPISLDSSCLVPDLKRTPFHLDEVVIESDPWYMDIASYIFYGIWDIIRQSVMNVSMVTISSVPFWYSVLAGHVVYRVTGSWIFSVASGVVLRLYIM